MFLIPFRAYLFATAKPKYESMLTLSYSYDFSIPSSGSVYLLSRFVLYSAMNPALTPIPDGKIVYTPFIPQAIPTMDVNFALVV